MLHSMRLGLPLFLLALAPLAPPARATPGLLAPGLPAAGLAVRHPARPGRVFLTVKEALELAFPGCEVKKETVFLTKAQQAEVAKLVKGGDTVRIVWPYVARKDGAIVGTAYFDTHKVRALKETLMVVVSPTEKVARIELLAFAEPPEYIPRSSWYGQFLKKPLSDDLNLGRGIRGVTGATLTGRAATRGVRRSLAVHHVLAEADAGAARQPAWQPARR